MAQFSKTTEKTRATERLFIRSVFFRRERTKRVTTLAFTMLALSIFGFFAISPTLATISQLKKEVSDAEYVDAKLKEKITALSALQAQYATMQNDIPFIVDALPQSPRIPSFLGQIQSLALSDHLVITALQTLEVSLSAASASDGKTPTAVTFSFAGEGADRDVLSFVDNLNTMNRITTIDTLSLTNDALKNTVQITIKGKAYFKG